MLKKNAVARSRDGEILGRAAPLPCQKTPAIFTDTESLSGRLSALVASGIPAAHKHAGAFQNRAMQASDRSEIAGIYRLPAGIRRDPQGWLRLSIPFHQRRSRNSRSSSPPSSKGIPCKPQQPE